MDASTDGTAEVHRGGRRAQPREIVLLPPVTPTRSHRRPRAGGRPGPARGAGSVGLRDGRRPAAPTRADRIAARASRVAATWISSSRAATARTAATRLRLGARDRLSLARRLARLLFPQRLRQVTDPMSGFFLVRRDAIDRGRAAPARLQDPARDPGSHTRASGRRGVVRLRRTARRAQQGDDPRGVALPVAARAAAFRPLRRSSAPRALSSTRSCLRS